MCVCVREYGVCVSEWGGERECVVRESVCERECEREREREVCGERERVRERERESV